MKTLIKQTMQVQKKKNPKLKINQEIICLIMAENSKYTNKLPKRAIKLTNH